MPIDFCLHCGQPITYDRPLSEWDTGWRHTGGYNHCDPDPSAVMSPRAQPDLQGRLL